MSSRRTRAIAAVALLAVLAFYAWTAATSAETALYRGRLDPYNLTASAVLHGRLDLPIAVPDALKALPNPYEASSRGSILSSDQQDLSYYHGRFYSYWGPVPALLLFVPFRALGLGDLPPAFAVLVLCFAGLLAALGLLRWLVRRFAPVAPAWAVGVCAALLALASTAPYLLRRPAQYEVALGGGYAFGMGALLLLLSGGLRERPSWGRLAAGSLCAGLAFGSRPPSGIGIAVAVALLVWRPEWRTPRAIAILLGPFAVCVLAYLAFNAARFGSPLEFGQTLQLTGGNPQDQHPSPSYTIPGLWYQLVEPPRLRAAFPYFALGPPPGAPFAVPKRFDGIEPTGGVLTCAPFIALLVAAPWALRRRAGALRAVVWGFVAMVTALLLFTTTTLNGTTQRYQMDYLPLLLLAAGLVWLVASDRRAWLVLGSVLAAWSITVATAVSFSGSKDTLQRLHPATFSALERFFSPLPTLATQVAGHPIIASVNGDASLGTSRYDALGVEGGGFDAGAGPVAIDVVAPRDDVVALVARIRPLARLRRVVPTVTVPGGTVVGRPADGATQHISVPLHRGLNTLALTLDSVPALAPDDPDAGRLAHVDALRLRVR